MKKKKTAIILAIVILLICGVVWAFWDRGPDPQVKKLQDMQKELFGGDGPPSREKMDQFREEMRKLTPEQHRELREPMREQMARRMEKTIDGYFSLPPDQRKPYLDKQIEEGEKRREEWEKRRREREANRGPSGQGPNRPGAGPTQGGRGPADANRGRPGGSRNSTPEQRAQRRNRRLDHTTPEQRAKWAEFRDALRKRRIELGLPAQPWGPRGPRGR
ncbi:MAG: hypothetical protein L6306_02070 [Planctomycetales bacterium]|nr:hypothetical protein [Planctomycetales bacterium]